LRLGSVLLGIAVIGLGATTAYRADRPAASRAAPAKPLSAPDAHRIVYPQQAAPTLEMSDGQKRPVYSLLNVRRRMKYGDYVWDDNGIAEGEKWIQVDLARQTLSVFRGGHEIGSTVILFGADSKPTPAGVFPVLEKARTHRSNLYDADMPFMLRLTMDGIAIHASDVREGRATHGCIGVPLAFAALLFGEIDMGDVVSISAA
jgi:lipoprotein-anchoring transpeptidase ErfK/SrfK